MKKCAICGTEVESGDLCPFVCHWTLEGWLGWNAKTNEVFIADPRAAEFDPRQKYFTYPKLIAKARLAGWTGKEGKIATLVKVKRGKV